MPLDEVQALVDFERKAEWKRAVAAVVAWLRKPETAMLRQNAGPLVFAAAIERGEVEPFTSRDEEPKR